MSRLIAIGDIHGMSAALQALLAKVGPRPDDELVFLGDYIDRGPDSKGVIDTITGLTAPGKVTCIRGNHEDMALAATLGKDEHAYWMMFGGVETLRSYGLPAPFLRPTGAFNIRSLPDRHPWFFASLLDYYETEHHIFVHAGCAAALSLDKQTGNDLRWNTPPDDLKHCSGKLVVCGHSPRRRVQVLLGLVRVDTGAGVWPHGRLSAVDVLSGKVWSVPAVLPVPD